MICKLCGRHHPGWVTCKKAAFDELARASGDDVRPHPAPDVKPQSTGPVDDTDQKVVKRGDRHKPRSEYMRAYMREYMAKRRAASKAT